LLEQPALEGPGLTDLFPEPRAKAGEDAAALKQPAAPARADPPAAPHEPRRSELSVQPAALVPVQQPQPGRGASKDLVQARQFLPAKRELDWRQKAPGWTAAVLAGIVVAELAQTAWVLKSIAMQPLPGPPGDLKARPPNFHWWRLAGAHLFGFEERPVEKEAAATRAQPITWALSAVLAMRDPSQGFAILGEQGKILKVLHAGAALDAVPGGRLLQVFADHVVLDLQGRTETVSLPKKQSGSAGGEGVRVAAVASPAMGAPVAEAVEGPAEPQVVGGRVPPSPVETVIRSLSPELAAFNGRGIRLHPGKPLQRLYGLRDGDVLTAINGVELTDPSALASAFKTPGDFVALTYTRDGVEETVNMPVSR
jgi:type II secretion system protein C